MNFVVFGIDHRMQASGADFEALLRAWLDKTYFEPLESIAEEYPENIAPSTARRLATERGLRWFNVDMSTDEKHRAGILAEQKSRPISEGSIAFRLPSDDLREAAWVDKLVGYGSPTTIVICGYLHFAPLVRTLRAAGHTVDARAYLETVPEIRLVRVSST